jgi:hypothetical protein
MKPGTCPLSGVLLVLSLAASSPSSGLFASLVLHLLADLLVGLLVGLLDPLEIRLLRNPLVHRLSFSVALW